MKNTLLPIIEKNLKLAQDQLKLSEGVLTSHNRIVVWPDSLITVDRDPETKKFYANPKVIAAQWTTVDADAICKNVVNGIGKRPISVSVCTYYRMKIDEYEDTLLALKD